MPFPYLTRIQAKNGHALFFPNRASKRIVSGRQFTRIGFRDQWVELELGLIEAEEKLEGDNRVALADGYHAEVVAHVKVRVDDSNLDDSVPKVVERFRCATTNDLRKSLDTEFFKPLIRNLLKEHLFKTMRATSYMDLLQSSGHRKDLYEHFHVSMKSEFEKCGFLAIVCELKRCDPVNPGMSNVDPAIVKLWTEWEEELQRVKHDRENRIKILTEEMDRDKDEFEAEVQKRKANLKAVTEANLNNIRLCEEQAIRDFDHKRNQIELEKASDKKDKEIRLTEIQEEADSVHREYQKQEIKFKANLERLQDEQKRELQQWEQEQSQAREFEAAVHRAEMRKNDHKDLQDEFENTKLRKQISEIKIEVEKAEGLLAAELKQAMRKAEDSTMLEKAKLEIDMVHHIFRQIPEILSNLPVERIGETTILQVGSDVKLDGIGTAGTVLGLRILPLLRDLLSGLAPIQQQQSAEGSGVNTSESDDGKASTAEVDRASFGTRS